MKYVALILCAISWRMFFHYSKIIIKTYYEVKKEETNKEIGGLKND
jgi:hypothetical protein